MKSLKNIFPLLSKQKSYLNFIEMLFDIIIVFDETDIRGESLSALNLALFESDVLEFSKFK